IPRNGPVRPCACELNQRCNSSASSCHLQGGCRRERPEDTPSRGVLSNAGEGLMSPAAPDGGALSLQPCQPSKAAGSGPPVEALATIVPIRRKSHRPLLHPRRDTCQVCAWHVPNDAPLGSRTCAHPCLPARRGWIEPV